MTENYVFIGLSFILSKLKAFCTHEQFPVSHSICQDLFRIQMQCKGSQQRLEETLQIKFVGPKISECNVSPDSQV